MDFTKEIKGHTLEYFDDIHVYLVDGMRIPSVTGIMKCKFGHKYDFVNPQLLERSARAGTAVHEAIENYCKYGEVEDLIELRNFRFLEEKFNFKPIDNEVPVVLFEGDEPICTGRLDLVIDINNELGLADIKHVSTIDKNYLAYQLNMYRLAYQQCYGLEIKHLHGIQLKDNKRKFIDIPINENLVTEIIEEWRKQNEQHK